MTEDAIALLNSLISTNASRRIRDANDDLSHNRIRHTQYLGDRTIQQLGQEPIENAVVLNNAANAIGDALMPLAKGSPLGRYDSVNQDDNVGTAKRTLLDLQANRDGNDNIKDRTGQQKPANNPLAGTPRGKDPLPKTYPPPYGCVPVGGQNLNCIWTASATPPMGYESHGSVVTNQDGELFLHCKSGIIPPPDLGCDFNLYILQVVATARFTVYGCVNKRYKLYYLATSSTVPSVVPTATTDAQCGGTIRVFEVYGSDLGHVVDLGANTVTASVVRLPSIPSASEEII